MMSATDEVASDSGELGEAFRYKGSRCSRWPRTLSGCRGKSTKSRKKAQMACCSGKSLNMRGRAFSVELERFLMAIQSPELFEGCVDTAEMGSSDDIERSSPDDRRSFVAAVSLELIPSDSDCFRR